MVALWGPLHAGGDGSTTTTNRVTWHDIKAADGCFFFSGPEGMGRDDNHGRKATIRRSGAEIVVAFEKTRFRGRIKKSGRFSAVRKAKYEYSGAQWETTETISGHWRGGKLDGRYSYEECDPTGEEGCPTNCTIKAGVSGIP